MKRNQITKKSFDAFAEMNTNPIEFMREKKFTLKDFNFSPRVANHWIEKGLIANDHQAGKKIKLSLSEAFWLKLVDQLRSFNVSLESIKRIKSDFFDRNYNVFEGLTKQQITEQLMQLKLVNPQNLKFFDLDQYLLELSKIQLNDFELMIQSILIERIPFFLIFDTKSNFILLKEGQFSNESEAFQIEYEQITRRSHIRISMNNVLEEFVESFGPLNSFERVPILTKQESEVVQLMRTEDVSKVEIRYNGNSKPQMVEITTKNMINERARLNEIILSRGYQDITLKTQNGHVVCCENTIKYKLDTE
jgi:hypothetical protein